MGESDSNSCSIHIPSMFQAYQSYILMLRRSPANPRRITSGGIHPGVIRRGDRPEITTTSVHQFIIVHQHSCQ
jgi:hypothetical protein